MPADPVAAAAGSLARRTGLQLPTGSRMRLHDAMESRAASTSDGDLCRYAALVDSDDVEADILFDLVSVGQTAFLRHPGLFGALEQTVLPECAVRHGDVHMVSAGCSTGEEAWTLAACAAARLGAGGFRVTAIDLCRQALEVARAGRYPEDALGSLPDRYLRWFGTIDGAGGPRVEVNQALRERVRFIRANLKGLRARFEPADVVLFCNVGIYFDRDVTEEVVATLAGMLRPGGYLFLGAAESLWGLDHELDLVDLGDVFAYRRRQGHGVERPMEQDPVASPPRHEQAGAAPERIASSVQAREVLASAQAALARGELDGAERAARFLLEYDEFDVGAHFVVASVAERSGAEDVVEAYRRVLYLDPGFALARACSATLLEQGGHNRRAAAEYRAAALGLAEAPARYEPYLEAMSAVLLADACRLRAAALG